MGVPMNLPKQIESYRPAVEAILLWMPDWISQHEFDDFVECENIMVRAWFIDDDTIHLGGSGGQRKELHLLQHMIRAKLVDCKTGKDGLIYYKAKNA